MSSVAIQLLFLILLTHFCVVSRTESIQRILKPLLSKSIAEEDNILSKREDRIEETDLEKDVKAKDTITDATAPAPLKLANVQGSENRKKVKSFGW